MIYLFKRYLVSAFLVISSSGVMAQVNSADSLLSLYNNSSNDTLKLSVLSSLVDYYSETQPDSANVYAGKMLELATKFDFPIEEAIALMQQGYALLNIGNYPRSLQALQKAIQIAENPASEKKGMPDRYYRSDEYIKTPVTARMRRLSILSQAHQYLGILYNNTNNNEKELSQYYIAIDLAENTGNIYALVTTNLTMGRVYLSMKKTDSALVFEEKAYDLVRKTGFKKYLGSILINLGRIQAAMGNNQKAMDYFKNAVTESAKQNYLRGVVAANLYIAELFKHAGQPDSSIHYQRAALKVAEMLNSASLLLRCYNALSSYYLGSNGKDSALKYQQLVIKLNDSLFNAKQFQQFENIDADEQQRKLEMTNARKQYQQRLQNYALLGGLLAFLFVAIILWRSNRQRQKINAKLQQQKTELETALEELKNAQAQLIQSEKMASLGELTAGIAHEIQNPLNFVNNFSELNNELILEMRTELKSGRIDNAINISNDIESNETKILEHGKRADSIVKSMLQHTRTGTGKKEEVNINELTEEHVRLAYHGWRAKDKAFNTKLETHFDESIPKIQMVPQDIGRVILNLVNNAFYAVSEDQPGRGKDYVPTVWVETKNTGNNLQVSIKDNGKGISKEVVDKIFQPFFTTKPAGQGTGLGLSLSYDIIKSHGGEIKAETVKGEGTTFIIILPII